MARMRRNSGKDPSFQFYWKDWRSDTKLVTLPWDVKGVWIDLICMSMDMPVRGVFHDGKVPLSKRQITNLEVSSLGTTDDQPTTNRRPTDDEPTTNGRPTDDEPTTNRQRIRRRINDAITMLCKRNIMKFMEDGPWAGSFYVKRVYEDMKLRDLRQAAGRKGGNPMLVGGKNDEMVNQNGSGLVNHFVRAKVASSSSSSSSYPYSPFNKVPKIGTCRRCDAPNIPLVRHGVDDTGVAYGLCQNCTADRPV